MLAERAVRDRFRLSHGASPTVEIPNQGDLIYSNSDDVTAAQLAVDGEIEKGKIARSRFLPSIWSFVLIDHTWLGLTGGFAPTSSQGV